MVITVGPSDPQANPTLGPTDTAVSTAPTSSSTSALNNSNKGSSGGGGLTPGSRTAIAVVVPVVVVALLVLAGLFFWRRRKQQKTAEEARREEVEGYGYNPNNDPTLPAVGGLNDPEMTQDGSGYRGWGNTTTLGASTTRQPSTGVSGGAMTAAFSDNGSAPGGYPTPSSPTQGTASDHHSGDPLMGNHRDTMGSDEIHALGAGPVAGSNRNGDIRRGVSNASSSYSAARGSENSGDGPSSHAPSQEYYTENPYHQPGPYGDNAYGSQQPVIRDVSARRNTRIENPSVFPQQGNSGIAQNF